MGSVIELQKQKGFEFHRAKKLDRPAEVKGTIIGLPAWQIDEMAKELTNPLTLAGRKEEIVDILVNASQQPDVSSSDIERDAWNDLKAHSVRTWATTIVENPKKAKALIEPLIFYTGQRSLEFGTPFADPMLIEATKRKPKEAVSAERKISSFQTKHYSIFSSRSRK